jgi:Glyoxalase-like domain
VNKVQWRRALGIELDHVFVACRPGAPEADELLCHGFVEGSSNVHPGQGTANRRFFFDNFMLELLWVVDQAEITSDQTRRTRLWERCSNPEMADSPFGILYRSDGNDSPPPFQTWVYSPSYLPSAFAIEIAEGTTLQEPELFYLPFLRARGSTTEPTNHRMQFRFVSSVAVGVRNPAALSHAALAAQKLGHIRYFPSAQPLLEINFNGAAKAHLDLRPTLPLVFRGEQ